MLSRDEKRRLAEIERRLAAADPALAEVLRTGLAGSGGPARAVLVVCALGALLLVLGLLTATFSLVFWSVVAFVCAAGAHVMRGERAGRTGSGA
ncbi:DUF3040 domain-containing protein [Saccharothrix lopnurensis]|uniref:DUF3040 domain-containing protein n=1 Tax=Saccharothrix lopnurensis TaxID=1670621 RepID=A0ABW1PC92_9PSEU